MLYVFVGIAVSAQTQFSINGGTTVPGSNLKNSDILGNGWNVNGNVYVPFWYSEMGGMLRTSIGVNIGFGYLQLKNGNPQGVSNGYNTLGQVDFPVIVSENDASRRNGFLGEGGLQANLAFGKITLSPILNIGYLSVGGSESKIRQKTTVNDQNYEFELFSQKNEAIKGVLLTPKFRISYFPGRIGLFAEASYASGGEIKNSRSTFKPSGNPVREDFYDLKQMLALQSETSEGKHPFNAVGFNAGITISLAGRSIKSNFNTSRSNIKNQISMNVNDSVFDPSGVIVVRGGRESGDELLSVVPDEQGTFKLNNLSIGVYEFSLTNPTRAEAQDFNTTRNNRDNRLVVNPQSNDTTTTTNTTSSPQAIGQGQDFNTTRNNRERGQLVINPDNPYDGIIVKAGKYPGESETVLLVDDEGTIRFEVLEAGDYHFIILTPEAGIKRGDLHENLNDKHIKDRNGSQKNNVLKTKHETAKNSISNVR